MNISLITEWKHVLFLVQTLYMHQTDTKESYSQLYGEPIVLVKQSW